MNAPVLTSNDTHRAASLGTNYVRFPLSPATVGVIVCESCPSRNVDCEYEIEKAAGWTGTVVVGDTTGTTLATDGVPFLALSENLPSMAVRRRTRAPRSLADRDGLTNPGRTHESGGSRHSWHRGRSIGSMRSDRTTSTRAEDRYLLLPYSEGSKNVHCQPSAFHRSKRTLKRRLANS